MTSSSAVAFSDGVPANEGALQPFRDETRPDAEAAQARAADRDAEAPKSDAPAHIRS